MKGGCAERRLAAPFALRRRGPTRIGAEQRDCGGVVTCHGMAPQTPVRPTMEPTERSMPPATMTTVMPISHDVVITVVWRPLPTGSQP